MPGTWLAIGDGRRRRRRQRMQRTPHEGSGRGCGWITKNCGHPCDKSPRIHSVGRGRTLVDIMARSPDLAMNPTEGLLLSGAGDLRSHPMAWSGDRATTGSGVSQSFIKSRLSFPATVDAISSGSFLPMQIVKVRLRPVPPPVL